MDTFPYCHLHALGSPDFLPTLEASNASSLPTQEIPQSWVAHIVGMQSMGTVAAPRADVRELKHCDWNEEIKRDRHYVSSMHRNWTWQGMYENIWWNMLLISWICIYVYIYIYIYIYIYVHHSLPLRSIVWRPNATDKIAKKTLILLFNLPVLLTNPNMSCNQCPTLRIPSSSNKVQTSPRLHRTSSPSHMPHVQWKDSSWKNTCCSITLGWWKRLGVRGAVLCSSTLW